MCTQLSIFNACVHAFAGGNVAELWTEAILDVQTDLANWQHSISSYGHVFMHACVHAFAGSILAALQTEAILDAPGHAHSSLSLMPVYMHLQAAMWLSSGLRPSWTYRLT
jgi:site-specific recombinase XerC